MAFFAPGQVLRMQDEEVDYEGMTLHLHPDFLRLYALGIQSRQFGSLIILQQRRCFIGKRKSKDTAHLPVYPR